MIVEVNDDDSYDGNSEPYSPELLVIRDKIAEDRMIRILAAETIQYAYRSYSSCKAAKKMKRVKSTDLLVKNIAAETITKGIKNKIAKNKSKLSITSKYAEDKASYNMNEDKVSNIFIDDNKEETKENDRKQEKSNEIFDDIDIITIISDNDSAPKSNRYNEYNDAKESKESKESKEGAPEIAKPPLFPLDLKFDSNIENKRSNKKKETRLKGKAKRQEKQIESRKEQAKEVIQDVQTISNHTRSSSIERSLTSVSIDTTTKKSSIIKQAESEIYVNKFAPPVPFIESPPDRYRVIDEAFAFSLNAQCSIVSLQAHEIAMVLDALGYELMDSISELKNRSSETIEVPMLSNAPLAAVLSFYGRNKRLVRDLDNFSVSEQMANIAVKHLSGLVQGPWIKVRALLLKYFNLPKDQVVRPSLWPNNWIHEFTKLLQFPEKYFSLLSGKAFLDIPKSFLKDVYGVIPSLLQARFVLYQHLFRLLDEWWDKGIRPNDLYKEKDSPKKPTKASRQQEAMKIMKAAVNWGKFEGKYSIYSDNGKVSKINIEICHFQMLLDTLVPLNRAYGWAIPLDRMTLLCGKVAGLKGYISIPSSSSQDVKGCRWVTLHKPLQSSHELLEALPDSLYSEYIGETRILIPIACMRPVVSNDTSIKPEDIKVGAVVKVISEEGLRQSLERFDWWDRPTTNTQNNILGLVGEVISISELESRQRVGVRFYEKNIIDALPIDAIVLVDDNDNIAIINGNDSDTGKKVEKKKKESSKKSKKKVTSNQTKAEATSSDAIIKQDVSLVKNYSSPIVPPLSLDILSSLSPKSIQLFNKADKLFRAAESLDFGSGNESKDEDFALSDRINITTTNNNINNFNIKNNNNSNKNNNSKRPSTAKERRLYRPIPSDEPKALSVKVGLIQENMDEEKKWVRDFDEDPIDITVNDEEIEEEPQSARYSWMKSIEIIKSPRHEEVKSPESPRSIKTAMLSIYQPQFAADDYVNPVSPKRRPKSAPNKRDKDKNDSNGRVGPRKYNKMISHENDYEPDQLPIGGPSLVYSQPIGVAGRNVKKKDVENDNLIYTPSPFIPEPPKFKYIPKIKEVDKNNETDINQVLVDSNQLGILGYKYGKNIDEIIANTNNDSNTNDNINERKNKNNKKPEPVLVEEPMTNKNNGKSLGSYLLQQQFNGDFLEGN